MKIGLVSDTHGNLDAVEWAAMALEGAELFLHAGDCAPDARYLAQLVDAPVEYVAGNCDFPNGAARMRTVEVEGIRIFLVHGDAFGVNYGLEKLAEAAREQGASVAVYGHTHVVMDVVLAGIRIFNPGSAARPRDTSEPSCMLLDLSQDGVMNVTVQRRKK